MKYTQRVKEANHKKCSSEMETPRVQNNECKNADIPVLKNSKHNEKSEGMVGKPEIKAAKM